MHTPSEQKIFDEIRREHDELRDILGNIRRELCTRAAAAGKLAELMSSLEKHVQLHFHEEEEGGFFHEVVCQAPRMSDRAEALKQEHVELAVAVARCVQSANEEKSRWKAMEQQFQEFSKALMHHESKENDLLLDAYDEDLGSAD